MTLQLLHSEFPYIWGKFVSLFCQCTTFFCVAEARGSLRQTQRPSWHRNQRFKEYLWRKRRKRCVVFHNGQLIIILYVIAGSRVSFETSFDLKQPKLKPKLVLALSKTKHLFRLFRFYTQTESFDVSIEPKQTEDLPKQFEREHIL